MIKVYLLSAATFLATENVSLNQEELPQEVKDCIERVQEEAKDCNGEINCALKNIAELRKCFDLEEESNEED